MTSTTRSGSGISGDVAGNPPRQAVPGTAILGTRLEAVLIPDFFRAFLA